MVVEMALLCVHEKVETKRKQATVEVPSFLPRSTTNSKEHGGQNRTESKVKKTEYTQYGL